MIYILIGVFVLYITINELRLKVSFDNWRTYMRLGTQARNSIDEKVGTLEDTVQDNYDRQESINERIEKYLSMAYKEKAVAAVMNGLVNKRGRQSQSPLKVKLPKSFGMLEADAVKYEAGRIKRRNAMRRYRAKVKAARGK